MAKTLKQEMDEALEKALRKITGDAADSAPLDKCRFGPTKSPEHGDFGTNAGLVLAKPLGKKPLEIAEELAAELLLSDFVAHAEAAPPGFVNVRLSDAAFAHVLQNVKKEGDDYGDNESGEQLKILLEFVSANPTGPMHIGHCRHAATGDCLARILRANGFDVTTEFYINDAGVQINALGKSFRARCYEAVTGEPPADDLQYSGDYLVQFAKQFTHNKSKADLDLLSEEDFAWEARNRNLEMIKRDLAAMGVGLDNWVSEKALLEAGRVYDALDRLRNSDATYEQDGALWLKTEDFGDDKDRVIVKSDGELTYLVPDIAYHLDKYERGHDCFINLFGADHSGYPPRLRAGIATLGHDPDKLKIILMRLVFLSKQGQRVKFSKRAGNFVALSDVVEEAGADATRWFMLSRSIDTEFEFDMDLATEQSSRNPVFKVQYAHARICSLEQKAQERGFPAATTADDAIGKLTSREERDIIIYLSTFPEAIERAGRSLDVHSIPAWLLGLADLLNSYYTKAKTDPHYRILQDDNRELYAARKVMLDAVRQVIANGLELMGISAPKRMTREEEEE